MNNIDDDEPRHASMITKLELVQDWLPRYTGMPLERFGEYVLLTNFRTYINRFAEKFGCQALAPIGRCRLRQTPRGSR
jgi:hypothetical protein